MSHCPGCVGFHMQSFVLSSVCEEKGISNGPESTVYLSMYARMHHIHSTTYGNGHIGGTKLLDYL